MNLKEAIEGANNTARVYGGTWHVVMIEDKLFSVHDEWCKRNPGITPFYTSADPYAAPTSVGRYRRAVRWLLTKVTGWLMKLI